MAKTNLLRHKCEIGATEEYFTEFKWVLKHWTLLYGSTYRHGVYSPAVKLNGTDGYTCTVSLDMTKDKPLILEFSDTQGVLAMKVTNSLNNIETHNNFFTGQIKKRHGFVFNASFAKGNPNYLFKLTDDADDTVTITVTIMIIKSVVISESLNKTDMSLKKSTSQLNQHDYKFLTNILENFKKMLDRQTLCDVTFIVQDKKFSAHKAVLTAQSKVFEAMFVNSSREQREVNIEMIDGGYVFEEFLNYLYTGEVMDLEVIAEEMIALADHYQVVNLKTMCEDCLIEQLSEGNAAGYAVIADKFSCNALKKRAIDLIQNRPQVLERALMEEDFETLTCLRAILSTKRIKLQ